MLVQATNENFILEWQCLLCNSKIGGIYIGQCIKKIGKHNGGE